MRWVRGLTLLWFVIACPGQDGWSGLSLTRGWKNCKGPAFQTDWAARGIPAGTNRTIVVLGSSTAAGEGASSPGRSWVGLLRASLSAQGIQVINASVSGSNTSNSLERFDKAVTPLKPAIVILATSLLNEGMMRDAEGSRIRYLENTRLLCSRVERIGAVPVVHTMYPNAAYGKTERAVNAELNRGLETLGWPILDFEGVTTNQNGGWPAEMSADGTHPTDKGHEAMFRSIPSGMFSNLLASAITTGQPRPGYWKGGSEGSGATFGQIEVKPAEALASWTIGVWARQSQSESSKGKLAVHTPLGEFALEMRGQGLTAALGGDEAEIETGDGSDPAYWRHLGLRYDSAARQFAVFVNGQLQFQTIVEGDLLAQSIELRGEGAGLLFSTLTIHQSAQAFSALQLPPQFVVPRASLLYWAPLNGPAAPILENYGMGTPLVNIGGSWSNRSWGAELLCQPMGLPLAKGEAGTRERVQLRLAELSR